MANATCRKWHRLFRRPHALTADTTGKLSARRYLQPGERLHERGTRALVVHILPGLGQPLFRALRYLKKEAVMVRFPDENHELSRSGKPWHRVERLQHIVGWFDKYLMK